MMKKKLLRLCFIFAFALTLNSCSRDEDLNESSNKTMSIKEISKRMVLAKLNSLNKKTMLKDVPKEYTDVAVKRLNNLKQELLSSPKENYTEDELLLIIDKASETDHDKIRLEMNQ